MAGATTLIWTDEAKEELLSIYWRLLDESEPYAEDWINEVTTKTDLLVKFPGMGRMVPDKDLSFLREIFVGRYRVIYTSVGEIIHIVAVRHMSRKLGRI